MEAVREAIRCSGTEKKLCLAFIGLSVADAALTMLLVSRGFLCMELMPHMTALMLLSPIAFWAYKIGATLIVIPMLFYLANAYLGLRRFIFIAPVLVVSTACIVGIVGLYG